MRCLIQNVVCRNVVLNYQKEYDKVSIEYGNIVKESVLLKDTNATFAEFWNFFTKELYLVLCSLSVYLKVCIKGAEGTLDLIMIS